MRSLKNIPHEKVIIVGEKPDWVNNVEYIPVAQDGTKNNNVRKSIATAAASDIISNNFLMMNDDFFIMKPLEAMPTLHFGTMREVIDYYNVRYEEGSDYVSSMTAQYMQLRELGIADPISYELHIPMVVNRQNIQQLFEKYGTFFAFQFRSFYGNCLNIGGEKVADVKIFLESRHNDPLYIENPLAYLETQTFLSATGGSFKRGLPGEFIRQKFPEKSEYEV